jgi:hypothetical protein
LGVIGSGVTQFHSLSGEELLLEEAQKNNISVTHDSSG